MAPTPPGSQPDAAQEKADRLRHLQNVIRPMMQDRPYHNVRHVEACLGALQRYRQHAEDPDAVELALWLHDAIYNPARNDNEDRSAQLGDELLKDLGYPPATIGAVHELVLATKHDLDPGTQDRRLIADIDLLILAEPEQAFDRYEQQIRQEYRHVRDAEFARGRARVLAWFLERDRLFYVLQEHELAARRNLQRAVTKWQTSVAVD